MTSIRVANISPNNIMLRMTFHFVILKAILNLCNLLAHYQELFYCYIMPEINNISFDHTICMHISHFNPP